MFLGDHVGYGADPGWVVDTVSAHVERGAVALLGNHDEAVVATGPRMNEAARAAIEWTRGQLDAGQRRFLAGLPLAVEEPPCLFVHASARDPRRWRYVADEAEAAASFAAPAASSKVTSCSIRAPC